MMKAVREILAEITTVSDTVAAYRHEERCRRLLESQRIRSSRSQDLMGFSLPPLVVY